MAVNVKATILNATVDTSGIATITVEFDDGNGKWQKSYKYNQTDPIDFPKFKNDVADDLRKDLKVKDQTTNLNVQIGKQFNITL